MQNRLVFEHAFTLAEVLITLGIIGIVAAMTLPSLIANYRERQFVAAAQKGYALVNNAMNKWLADNDIIGDHTAFWYSEKSNSDLLKSFSKQLNVVSLCTNWSVAKCGGKYTTLQYKKMNDGKGNTQLGLNFNEARAVLSDGMFISIASESLTGDCVHTFWKNAPDADGYYIPDASSPSGYKGAYFTSYVCGFVMFDTNGLKGPNQVGVDVFGVGFESDGRNYTDNIRGNLKYVLQNDKLIHTEHYTAGSYK